MIATLGVAVLSASSSFLPMAALNWKNCGDWSGQAAEQAMFAKVLPGLHVAVNSSLIVLQNLAPPVFPMADRWNRAVTNAMSPSLERRLSAIFEPGAVHFALPEMQSEESCGLGFGLAVLAILTFLATALTRRPPTTVPTPPRVRLFRAAILGGAWVALLPLLAVSGASSRPAISPRPMP